MGSCLAEAVANFAAEENRTDLESLLSERPLPYEEARRRIAAIPDGNVLATRRAFFLECLDVGHCIKAQPQRAAAADILDPNIAAQRMVGFLPVSVVPVHLL